MTQLVLHWNYKASEMSHGTCYGPQAVSARVRREAMRGIIS